MAVTPDVKPDTCTGTNDCPVVLLFPNRPLALRPQHIAAPDTTAHEWFRPTAMAVTPDVNPDTCTGTFDRTVESFPNRPSPLLPQHLAAPDTTAQEWLLPTAIAVTPDVNPDTCTGTFEYAGTELSPNWPLPLSPQHLAAPDTTAHVCVVPAEIAVTPDVKPDTCTGAFDCANTELVPNWP